MGKEWYAFYRQRPSACQFRESTDIYNSRALLFYHFSADVQFELSALKRPARMVDLEDMPRLRGTNIGLLSSTPL